MFGFVLSLSLIDFVYGLKRLKECFCLGTVLSKSWQLGFARFVSSLTDFVQGFTVQGYFNLSLVGILEFVSFW